MEKVELHHAFVWICDKCGKENTTLPYRVEFPPTIVNDKYGGNAAFQGAFIGYEPLVEDPDDEDDNYDEEDEEDEEIDEDFQLEVGHSEIYLCPNRVICRYCKTEFETYLDN